MIHIFRFQMKKIKLNQLKVQLIKSNNQNKNRKIIMMGRLKNIKK